MKGNHPEKNKNIFLNSKSFFNKAAIVTKIVINFNSTYFITYNIVLTAPTLKHLNFLQKSVKLS
jgi:hypothetical protein